MTIQLRPYQQRLCDQVKHQWASGKTNVCGVSSVGSGKTVTMAHLIREEQGPVCAIAHRQELVSQISQALAREGIFHRVIAPEPIIKFCSRMHMRELGESFQRTNAPVAVAGVDTILNRKANLAQWSSSVGLWVIDECHHVCGNATAKPNKWGKAVAMFPNARGLGVTATPVRSDRKGLGRHADGPFDTIVEGPAMRSLIDAGYLSEYRIFAPESDIDISTVEIGSTGDFKAPQLKKAVEKSHIIGDVVAHYKRIAMGKLGITFATDVETASRISKEYNEAGVPAQVVSGKTPDATRQEIIDRFRRREYLQLVNCDIFGEGFDLPAVEVVTMARPTQSYGLFVQQFGRALRPAPGKTHAIIIDHVGNVHRHGLPDAPRQWTLDRGAKRESGPSDAPPVRTCPQCTAVYERTRVLCPACGYAPVPAERSGPEHVDGDLTELSPEALTRLRGDVLNLDQDLESTRGDLMARNWTPVVVNTHIKRKREDISAQRDLRDAMSWWGGHMRAKGVEDRVSYRTFYHRFKIDVLTAQSLKKKDSLELAERITIDYSRMATEMGVA